MRWTRKTDKKKSRGSKNEKIHERKKHDKREQKEKGNRTGEGWIMKSRVKLKKKIWKKSKFFKMCENSWMQWKF